MSWPAIDRPPVHIPPMAGHDAHLWDSLLELSELRPGEWTLVGGQMVFLHAVEHGITPPRISTDLDIVVNARIVAGAIAALAADLVHRGFHPDGISPDNIAHRYRRDRVTIDVLAPDGLGARADLTTTPPGRTLQVPGGTQALDRTELVPLTTGARTRLVPRPSLLGAIVSKAVAVRVDDVPDAQRLDFVILVSLVDDPFVLAEQLTRTDKRRIRARSELLDPAHRIWSQLDPPTRDRALGALRILSR